MANWNDLPLTSLIFNKKHMPPLNEIASQIRRDILRMVHGANSGHPGG